MAQILRRQIRSSVHISSARCIKLLEHKKAEFLIHAAYPHLQECRNLFLRLCLDLRFIEEPIQGKNSSSLDGDKGCDEKGEFGEKAEGANQKKYNF